MAGKTHHQSAVPLKIYGENYRVKDIESADTQYIDIKTNDYVEIQLITTHATTKNKAPVTEYLYEEGKIIWQAADNGKTKVYRKVNDEYEVIEQLDNGDMPIKHLVFINTIEAINNKNVPLCDITNSWQHTICVNKSFESSEGVVVIDKRYAERKNIEKKSDDISLDISNGYNIVIKGIEDLIKKMYSKDENFYKAGAEWARKSTTVINHDVV